MPEHQPYDHALKSLMGDRAAEIIPQLLPEAELVSEENIEIKRELLRADLVYLTGEVSGLGCADEVADDDSRCVRGEVAERRRPLASAGVQDNVMAFTDEDTGGGAAESVGGAGDKDTGHGDDSSAGGVLAPIRGAGHIALRTGLSQPGRRD